MCASQKVWTLLKRPEIRVMQQFDFETYHKCIKSLQTYLIQQNIAFGNQEERL